MLKHLEIAPDALEVGYILDEDVYENHVLLIRKGQVVTDHIKELLQTRKTVKIVHHVPEESVYLEKDLSDDRIVRLNEQVKTRITEDVTKLFDDIESDSNASLAQNISDTIVNDVLKKTITEDLDFTQTYSIDKSLLTKSKKFLEEYLLSLS